jgi:hypothetical protein
VEQVEISALHGAMGKLISLQPMLKSHIIEPADEQ